MDSVNSSVTKPQPGDKICISLDCNTENPYIDPEQQEIHEHNGVISAVRIGKVQQIHKNILSTSTWVQETRAHLQNVKNKVVNLIDQFLENISADFSAVGGIEKQLGLFLDGKGTGKFGEIWKEVKENMKYFGATQEKLRHQSLLTLKDNINKIIQTKNQSQKEVKTYTERIDQKSAQFLQNYSNIFTYLNLELKSKLSESILGQLRGLKPTSRQTQRLTAKLYQICDQNEQALSIYNLMLKQNNLDTEVLSRKCLLLKRSKKYQEAYDELIILIDLIEGKGILNDKYYHFQKAQVCRALAKYIEAQKQLQMCKGGSEVKAWKLDREQGHVQLKKGNYQVAVNFYKNALKSQELSIDDINQIHESIFECSQALNNNKLAIESLSVLYKNKPSQFEYLFKRARLYHLEKQHSKAAEDYSAAIQKVQNIPGLYYNRAVELIYAGESQASIPDLKKAIELDPNFKEAVHLLANTSFDLFLRKDTKPDVAQHLKNLAINTYSYCLKFYPTNYAIWHNLGALESDKNYQKAYDYFSKAIEINPSHLPSFLGKIKTAIKMHKDSKQTLNDINVMIKLGDRTPSTFLLKAALEAQLNLVQQSSQSVEAVLKADPSNKQALSLKQRLVSRISAKKTE